MKKVLALLLCVMFLSTSLLAGCGKKDAAVKAEASTEETSSVASSEESAATTGEASSAATTFDASTAAATPAATVTPSPVPEPTKPASVKAALNTKGVQSVIVVQPKTTTYPSKLNTLPIVKTPVTIKVTNVDNWYAQVSWASNPPVLKKLEELTNVKVKWDVLPDDQYWGTVKLKVASGKNLSDLTMWQQSPPPSVLAKQKIAIELDKYIEAGAPNLKKLWEEYPVAKKLMKAGDGHFYNFSWITPGNSYITPYSNLIIRRDWVEKKLGMKLPTNTQELYTVLKAMKDKDPNGNGKKDEIPFTFEWPGGASLLEFAQYFGISLSSSQQGIGQYYWDSSKSKVLSGWDNPHWKDFLTWVSKAYKEGLLDQEFSKTNTDLMKQKIANNVAGTVANFVHNIKEFTTSSREGGAKDADWYAMTPIKDYYGKQIGKTIEAGISPHSWWISRDCKIPDVVVKWVDYLAYSREGYDYRNFGIQGLTYTRDAQGVPHFTDFVTKNKDGLSVQQVLWSQGAWHLLPGIVAVPEMKSTYEPLTAFIESDPYKSEYITREDKLYGGNAPVRMPVLPSTPEEAKAIDKVFKRCDTFINEEIAKFTTGQKPVSEWDSFVKDLKAMGLDDEKKIMQGMLDRFNSGK